MTLPPSLNVKKLFCCLDTMVKSMTKKNLNDTRRLVEYFQLSTSAPVHSGLHGLIFYDHVVE